MHTQKNEKKINMERERERVLGKREREIGNKLFFFIFHSCFFSSTGALFPPLPTFSSLGRTERGAGGRALIGKRRGYI
jgi:hypothetical protein